GTIDRTLFIRRKKEDFILVQVYMDDIIFGSLNPQLCREFKALMHEKFQMSAMGERNFFLGLQVLQKEDGIFLSQDKYIGYILKKIGYSDVRSSNTPMDKDNPWGKDRTRKDVDLHLYRSMIGSLMYLTVTRLDIMFAVCACARHQVTPKECHLHAVKRIFRYLKGHPKPVHWYPKASPFDLVAYSDSDYGGASQDWVRPIGTEWVFKNKKDERGIVVQNKARLVAQGHTQKEGNDYDEVFAPVARIRAIRLFLAYASFMGFTVYQMDVNSAFLYGTIDEEVYVMQPPGIQDPAFPAKVYKVEKAMYGTLSKYLLMNGFHRGTIDQTLFIRREFEALMHKIFQMSAMGELNFFLSLQVLQKEDGIFLSQDNPNFSGMIVPIFDTMLIHQGEGSGTPTEPHHTPIPEADTSHPTTSSIPLPSLSTAPIPPVTQTNTTPIKQYSRRARIAQSSALPTEEILSLKERVQVLEDRDSVAAKHSRDDAPIKGRSINEGEAADERISNDSEEVARVLTSMDAATVLAGGINVPTGSGSIPTAGPPAADISTGSEVAPTASPIVTASLIVSSYLRRKGKEVMVESDTPKKQKLQEQIDAQVARELEEQQEKEDMRMNEQIARDAEVARIHAEEELQGMIDSLDRSNETIAKYLQEYQDFASELPLEKNNLGWKVKDFKGFSFEEIEAKFAKVWKQKQKSSKEAPEMEKSTEEITEEKVKEMMQLVPVEDVYVQAFQVKHPIIDWKQLDREDLNQLWALVKEYLSIRPATSKKEMELWVELKKLYEPDPEDQLWTLTQNFMHAPVECKLYDLSGVHHLTAKDKEIFMLVEKDYPIRKGLALVMISYKLQGRIIRNKMHKAFPLLVRKFPLPEGTSHCLKMNATVRRIEMPLPEVCTDIEEKKKNLLVKDRWQLH
nr:uncharacterized mitochondrial protein AtMg00810-like [Tanacetum cinerariifolium]